MGATFATILLLVARVAKTGSQNIGKIKEKKQNEILGAGRGGEQPTATNCGGSVVPPLRLVTFGSKTELSLERGAFSGFPEYLLR